MLYDCQRIKDDFPHAFISCCTKDIHHCDGLYADLQRYLIELPGAEHSEKAKQIALCRDLGQRAIHSLDKHLTAYTESELTQAVSTAGIPSIYFPKKLYIPPTSLLLLLCKKLESSAKLHSEHDASDLLTALLSYLPSPSEAPENILAQAKFHANLLLGDTNQALPEYGNKGREAIHIERIMQNLSMLGHQNTLSLLIEKGAIVTQTAINIAVQYGHMDVLGTLLRGHRLQQILSSHPAALPLYFASMRDLAFFKTVCDTFGDNISINFSEYHEALAFAKAQYNPLLPYLEGFPKQHLEIRTGLDIAFYKKWMEYLLQKDTVHLPEQALFLDFKTNADFMKNRIAASYLLDIVKFGSDVQIKACLYHPLICVKLKERSFHKELRALGSPNILVALKEAFKKFLPSSPSDSPEPPVRNTRLFEPEKTSAGTKTGIRLDIQKALLHSGASDVSTLKP